MYEDPHGANVGVQRKRYILLAFSLSQELQADTVDVPSEGRVFQHETCVFYLSLHISQSLLSFGTAPRLQHVLDYFMNLVLNVMRSLEALSVHELAEDRLLEEVEKGQRKVLRDMVFVV